jgi:hypothetical protein
MVDPRYGPSRCKWNIATDFTSWFAAASGGWNWAIDVDARTVRGGQAMSEQAAIKAAERLIDGVLAPPKQKLTLVRPSRDGRP